MNSEGIIVGKALVEGGKAEGVASNVRLRANYWAIVTVCSDPVHGSMSVYIDGKLCHTSTELDTFEISLQNKVIIFGGGKIAHARGGDIRRVLVQKQVIALTEASIQAIYMQHCAESPAIGGRVTKLQAVLRGWFLRKKRGIWVDRRSESLLKMATLTLEELFTLANINADTVEIVLQNLPNQNFDMSSAGMCIAWNWKRVDGIKDIVWINNGMSKAEASRVTNVLKRSDISFCDVSSYYGYWYI